VTVQLRSPSFAAGCGAVFAATMLSAKALWRYST
jgi:hypothetical protein